MILSFDRLFSARLSQRIALTMAVTVLAAGIAQASHYHKSEPIQGADRHTQCLVCLYSASSAAPASVARLIDAALIVCTYCQTQSMAFLQEVDPASYDARGPPLA